MVKKKPLYVSPESPLWRVHTPNLLNEIMNNNGTWALRKPLQVFGGLLYQVGERAAQLNDPKLNNLMVRLCIYTIGDPTSPDYDKEATQKILNQ